MIENIKNEIYQQLDILFAETVTYELTNDMINYQKRLKTIAQISSLLNVILMTEMIFPTPQKM